MGDKGETFIDWVMEMLAPLGATKRAMFGGYGLFADGKMFALVSKTQALYLKVDDSNRHQYEEAGSVAYRPMPYFSVPDHVLEDARLLRQWAQQSIAVARAAPSKKQK